MWGAEQSKNFNSDLLIVKYCKILKYINPSLYYLFLVICHMYSYVLYYNIENSSFNAVSAYLLLIISVIFIVNFIQVLKDRNSRHVVLLFCFL